MTVARRDALCGGAPTLLLRCPYCSRTVGPYYEYREAKIAIDTHINWRHFPDATKPVPFQPKKLTRAHRKN